MTHSAAEIISLMTEYERGVPHRIQHFIKVYTFAVTLAERENVGAELTELITVAALLHDIGIKPSIEKYGSSAGEYQQREGVQPAREMMERLGGYTSEFIGRVCFLIAHHHTYSGVDGIDRQLLLESDFLVNAFEDGLEKPSILTFREKVFRTKSGTELLNTMFGL